MAARRGLGWWEGAENPFPRAAVAHASARWQGRDVPTILTPAVEETRQLIDEYVSETLATGDIPTDSGFPPDDGRVVVIEGGYGTGKTHLVLEALDRVGRARMDGLDPRPIYRVAPGGSFLLLYTDVMRGIGSDEMLARVLEFYADIVEDDLRNHPFADQLFFELDRDQEDQEERNPRRYGLKDPQAIVSRYGLKEGALLARLRERLSFVTGDETFSRALLLLLQPELREMVWEWFAGGVPGQLLRENGLAKPIDTDIQALEALGVIASIYRREERRFVLAVDEMEKLAISWDISDKGKSQAFKKLLEIFRQTGALLIMAGLPDIFDILPPETQRVDRIIRPSELRSQDIRWFVEKSMASLGHPDTIEPFTDEGIDFIVYLTGGLARDVVRLCYHSYQNAAISGELIGSKIVSSVARNQSRKGSREVVRHEIRRLLDEQGRNPIEGWIFSDLPEVPVDFWIPVGDRDAGCAVLISDSIFDEHQAGIIAERVSMIRSESGRRVVQVVSGYLPAELRSRLVEALRGEPPVVYDPRSFDADFTRAVERVVGEAVQAVAGEAGDTPESLPGSAVLQWLRQETGRLARQQSTMLRLIQRSAGREEQLLSMAQRALMEPAPEAAGPPPGLPPRLEQMFGAAERSLAAYGDLSARIDETFTLAVEAPSAVLSLVSRVGDADAFGSVGAVTFLADLLRGFRLGIRDWLDAREQAAGRAGAPNAREQERLRRICQTYDTLYGAVPLFRLDRLPTITSPLGADGEPPTRADRALRSESLRGTLDGLGDRVYATALEIEGGGGEPTDR